MLREIYEQPNAIRRVLRQYVPHGRGALQLDPELEACLGQVRQVLWAGCGSSHHANALAAYAAATLAGLPSVMYEAHELVAFGRAPWRAVQLAVLASQSGETADTLEAMAQATQHACPTVAIVNAAASSLSQKSRWQLVLQAGPEVAIPSTKGFLAHAVAGLVLAVAMARARLAANPTRAGGLELGSGADALLEALHALPEHVEAVLHPSTTPIERDERSAAATALDAASDGTAVSADTAAGTVAGVPSDPPGSAAQTAAGPRGLTELVASMVQARHVVFLGRGPDVAIAREGALKLMEAAYLPAQAFATGEFKHGPMAGLDAHTPVVAVVTPSALTQRTRDNLDQVRACGAPVFWLGPRGVTEMEGFDGTHISLPAAHPLTAPLLAAVVLQLAARTTAHRLGYNPDAPRHLVKSVRRL